MTKIKLNTLQNLIHHVKSLESTAFQNQCLISMISPELLDLLRSQFKAKLDQAVKHDGDLSQKAIKRIGSAFGFCSATFFSETLTPPTKEDVLVFLDSIQ